MRLPGLLLLLFLAGCQAPEPPEKIAEVPTGYRGEARLNPYLAAETYLREKGYPVESSRVWAEEGRNTSLLFMPASFLKTSGMVKRVLAWVAEGRTLAITVEGGEPERNDFTDLAEEATTGESGEENFAEVDELLEALKIERVMRPEPEANEEMAEGALSRPWEVVRTKEEYGNFALEFEGRVGLRVKDGWSWTPVNQEGSRIVGTTYGNGVVLVFAHARPFRNPYLARSDHAEFLDYLLRNYGNDSTVFLYGASASFFGLIWQEGKMAVIGGLAVLVAWLWMRIPRFGPVMRDRAIRTHSYGESLTASARFLWRTGQLDALFTPLRRRAEEAGTPAGGDAAKITIAADDPDDQEEAGPLPPDLPKDPGLILKTVQKLQQQLKS